MRFHLTRDTEPARWYRKADGSPDTAYDDLPAAYRGNLAAGQPFAGTWVPDAAQMADLLAFLGTLEDADQMTPAALNGPLGFMMRGNTPIMKGVHLMCSRVGP